MYPSCTLGSACRCRFIADMTRVTRENGRSRDPYPPATVSLLTNPSAEAKSARTIRIIDLLKLVERFQADRCRAARMAEPRCGRRSDQLTEDAWTFRRGGPASAGDHVRMAVAIHVRDHVPEYQVVGLQSLRRPVSREANGELGRSGGDLDVIAYAVAVEVGAQRIGAHGRWQQQRGDSEDR